MSSFLVLLLLFAHSFSFPVEEGKVKQGAIQDVAGSQNQVVDTNLQQEEQPVKVEETQNVLAQDIVREATSQDETKPQVQVEEQQVAISNEASIIQQTEPESSHLQDIQQETYGETPQNEEIINPQSSQLGLEQGETVEANANVNTKNQHKLRIIEFPKEYEEFQGNAPVIPQKGEPLIRDLTKKKEATIETAAQDDQYHIKTDILPSVDSPVLEVDGQIEQTGTVQVASAQNVDKRKVEPSQQVAADNAQMAEQQVVAVDMDKPVVEELSIPTVDDTAEGMETPSQQIQETSVLNSENEPTIEKQIVQHGQALQIEETQTNDEQNQNIQDPSVAVLAAPAQEVEAIQNLDDQEVYIRDSIAETFIQESAAEIEPFVNSKQVETVQDSIIGDPVQEIVESVPIPQAEETQSLDTQDSLSATIIRQSNEQESEAVESTKPEKPDAIQDPAAQETAETFPLSQSEADQSLITDETIDESAPIIEQQADAQVTEPLVIEEVQAKPELVKVVQYPQVQEYDGEIIEVAPFPQAEETQGLDDQDTFGESFVRDNIAPAFEQELVPQSEIQEVQASYDEPEMVQDSKLKDPVQDTQEEAVIRGDNTQKYEQETAAEGDLVATEEVQANPEQEPILKDIVHIYEPEIIESEIIPISQAEEAPIFHEQEPPKETPAILKDDVMQVQEQQSIIEEGEPLAVEDVPENPEQPQIVSAMTLRELLEEYQQQKAAEEAQMLQDAAAQELNEPEAIEDPIIADAVLPFEQQAVLAEPTIQEVSVPDDIAFYDSIIEDPDTQQQGLSQISGDTTAIENTESLSIQDLSQTENLDLSLDPSPLQDTPMDETSFIIPESSPEEPTEFVMIETPTVVDSLTQKTEFPLEPQLFPGLEELIIENPFMQDPSLDILPTRNNEKEFEPMTDGNYAEFDSEMNDQENPINRFDSMVEDSVPLGDQGQDMVIVPDYVMRFDNPEMHMIDDNMFSDYPVRFTPVQSQQGPEEIQFMEQFNPLQVKEVLPSIQPVPVANLKPNLQEHPEEFINDENERLEFDALRVEALQNEVNRKETQMDQDESMLDDTSGKQEVPKEVIKSSAYVGPIPEPQQFSLGTGERMQPFYNPLQGYTPLEPNFNLGEIRVSPVSPFKGIHPKYVPKEALLQHLFRLKNSPGQLSLQKLPQVPNYGNRRTELDETLASHLPIEISKDKNQEVPAISQSPNRNVYVLLYPQRPTGIHNPYYQMRDSYPFNFRPHSFPYRNPYNALRHQLPFSHPYFSSPSQFANRYPYTSQYGSY